MSTAIYLSFAVLLGRETSKRTAWILLLGATLLVAAIGISRIVLHLHNSAEVLAGFGIGLFAHLYFRWTQAGRSAVGLPVAAMAISGITLIAALHSGRWKVEARIDQIAEWLRFSLPWC